MLSFFWIAPQTLMQSASLIGALLVSRNRHWLVLWNVFVANYGGVNNNTCHILSWYQRCLCMWDCNANGPPSPTFSYCPRTKKKKTIYLNFCTLYVSTRLNKNFPCKVVVLIALRKQTRQLKYTLFSNLFTEGRFVWMYDNSTRRDQPKTTGPKDNRTKKGISAIWFWGITFNIILSFWSSRLNFKRTSLCSNPVTCAFSHAYYLRRNVFTMFLHQNTVF